MVRILHLYHDLLNLYGEYGNVLALKRSLEAQGLECEVVSGSIGDEPNIPDFDFVYIASGTEKKLLLALDDIRRLGEGIKNALSGGTVFLCTGNSLELFGKRITDGDGNDHDGLAIFDYFSVMSKEKRELGDCIAEGVTSLASVGFVNKASKLYGVKSPMFRIKHGVPNCSEDNGEGFASGSFYGTYLIGPCLVKNPHLLGYFTSLICKRAGVECKELPLELEKKAYKVTLDALCERFEG